MLGHATSGVREALRMLDVDFAQNFAERKMLLRAAWLFSNASSPSREFACSYFHVPAPRARERETKKEKIDFLRRGFHYYYFTFLTLVLLQIGSIINCKIKNKL
jgi:hypothetical protein